MARSSSYSFIKLKNYLNLCYNYGDTQLSLNNIPVRYLRRSRYSKDHLEELKYQRLLRTLKYGSKPLEPAADTAESISAKVQENVSENISEHNSEKECQRITAKDLVKRLEDKINPLKGLVYTKQLEKKHKKSLVLLRALGQKLKLFNIPIAMGDDKLPCPVDYVIPSPVLEGYRNKDEFNIGLGLDGNDKTVGFFLDCPTEFSTTFCISPKELTNIRENHKRFVEDFQGYVRLSPLPATQHHSDKGYWKYVTVRSNCAGDLMGIVVMNPQELSQAELQMEKEKLKDYFLCLSRNNYNLQSLYFQTCTQSRCTHEQSPFELLMGDPFIIEETNNMVLHISPDSFYHINTKAAEAMFDSLLKFCRVNKSTTILDINCGVGPVSLMFSPRVKKCIGIDDSMQAIIDAKLNAMENRSQNVEFIYGKPEHVIKDVLENEYCEELLVILNSSRYLINKSFISLLREYKKVEKIVYVSTKPQIALDNYIHLCKPCGSYRNLREPFLPIMAVPFDFCPHTEQFGLIVMFQRL